MYQYPNDLYFHFATRQAKDPLGNLPRAPIVGTPSPMAVVLQVWNVLRGRKDSGEGKEGKEGEEDEGGEDGISNLALAASIPGDGNGTEIFGVVCDALEKVRCGFGQMMSKFMTISLNTFVVLKSVFLLELF